MNPYEQLAEAMLASMDAHRHAPPEPVSATIRGEMAVLRLLGQEGAGLSAGAISSMLSMTTSRIAAVLGSLEKKGLITRTPDLQDKRRVLVTLTQKGDDYRLARRGEAKAHLTGMLSRLSEEDAATFVRLVGRLFYGMNENQSSKEA